MLETDVYGYVRAIALSIFRQTKIKPKAVTTTNNMRVQYTAFDADEVTRSKRRHGDKRNGDETKRVVRAHTEGRIRFNRKDRRDLRRGERRGGNLSHREVPSGM